MSYRLDRLIHAAQEAQGFLRAIPCNAAALSLSNRIDAILDPNYDDTIIESIVDALVTLQAHDDNEPANVHYVTLTKLPNYVDVDGGVLVYEGAEAEYNFAHK